VYLAAPSDDAWQRYRDAYMALIEERFRENRKHFDQLADLARENDVFIGCSCPTIANPKIDHCHTYLALEFMRSKYPKLRIKMPNMQTGARKQRPALKS